MPLRLLQFHTMKTLRLKMTFISLSENHCLYFYHILVSPSFANLLGDKNEGEKRYEARTNDCDGELCGLFIQGSISSRTGHCRYAHRVLITWCYSSTRTINTCYASRRDGAINDISGWQGRWPDYCGVCHSSVNGSWRYIVWSGEDRRFIVCIDENKGNVDRFGIETWKKITN